MEIVKKCSKCKIGKELIFFSSNKSQRDGLSNQCKACNSLTKKKATDIIQQKRLLIKVELLEDEVFTPVVYGGLIFNHKISNKGRLISHKYGGEKLLSPTMEMGKSGRNGYLITSLRYPDKSKYYNVRIHRLVAIAFIDNPLNLPQVNHIDGDKSNNIVSNLEWCDSTYNIKHSYQIGLNVAKKGQENASYNKGRKVILNGVVYGSITDCARQTGYFRANLSSELAGKMKAKVGVSYAD